MEGLGAEGSIVAQGKAEISTIILVLLVLLSMGRGFGISEA
jgi:hypothetical protein